MEAASAIELRDLRWAVTAAQHRSLRQAAQALSVRQSTLSRRLCELEYRLGVELFERTNGGTRPTAMGCEFLDVARRIVGDIEAVAVRLHAHANGQRGGLTLGVHASLAAGNLRATLIEHRRRHPEVMVRLVDGSKNHLIAALANLGVDIVFAAGDEPVWHDRSLPVWGERVVVALPEGHPLGRQDIVHWSELRGETFLVPERGPGPEFLKLLKAKAGAIAPEQVLRHDVALDRFLTLVGAGWGALLALEGATGMTYPGVVFREIHDADGPTRVNFRAFWRHANGNPALQQLLELLRERFPELVMTPSSV